MAPHPDACFGYRCEPRISKVGERAIEVPQDKVDLVDSSTRIDLSDWAPAARYQGSLGSCHDDATEVLTDAGFKRFSDLDGNERLATVNPATRELIFEQPTRLVRFRYQGKLICAKNTSLDFRVTPDHNMLVRRWNEGLRTLGEKYEFVPAGRMGWYSGLMNRVVWRGEQNADSFLLPGVDHKLKAQRISSSIPMRSWLRFLGVYLAEGTMIKRSQRRGSVSHKIQMAAFKPREKDFVREVLRDIGVKALELRDRFTFSNKRIYEALASLGLEGVKAAHKFVPRFVFAQGADMIREFLAGHFAGDGSELRGMRSHYTGSTRLSSDLHALIFLSGDETRVSVRNPRTSIMRDGRTVRGSLREYRVSVCSRKKLFIEAKKSLFEEDYDGEVFCAEVPSFHTLVTRRGGRILISGNCTAHAGAAAARALMDMAAREGLFGGQPFDVSTLGVYQLTLDRTGHRGVDFGASGTEMLRTLARGFPREDAWPYSEVLSRDLPPQSAMTSRRVVAWRQVPHTVRAIRACLAMSCPVLIGIPVFDGDNGMASQRAFSTGDVHEPASGDELSGWHMVAVWAHDPATRRFVFQNWWRGFGDDRCLGTIPEDYVIGRANEILSVESVR